MTANPAETVSRDDRSPVFYTADVVLFGLLEGVQHVLLIERGWDPFKGLLAFPGGHVEPEETSEQAARRELAEETGVEVPSGVLNRVGIYDEPGRDPRGRYVTVAYTASLGSAPALAAGDDAASAQWVPWHRVHDLASEGGLAFDHGRIFRAALRPWPLRSLGGLLRYRGQPPRWVEGAPLD